MPRLTVRTSRYENGAASTIIDGLTDEFYVHDLASCIARTLGVSCQAGMSWDGSIRSHTYQIYLRGDHRTRVETLLYGVPCSDAVQSCPI